MLLFLALIAAVLLPDPALASGRLQEAEEELILYLPIIFRAPDPPPSSSISVCGPGRRNIHGSRGGPG